MSLEAQLTELNRNIVALTALLSQQGTVSMTADRIGPGLVETEDKPQETEAAKEPVDEIADSDLVAAAVRYADQHGREAVVDLVHAEDVAPSARIITDTPQDKRALLLKRLQEGV